MIKTLKYFLMLGIINNFFTSCAGIPSGRVKLENYPKNEIYSSLDLGYSFVKQYPDVEEKNFNEKIELNFSQMGIKNYSMENCLVRISSYNEVKDNPLLGVYAWASMLTLFILPYYVPLNYEAKATLISYPNQTQLKGKAINIKSNQAGAKEGDYFLDENDRLVKLLKTYELKDKVHEVWSLLWMLSWLIVEPNKYAPNAEYPKDAQRITEDKISEALTRSIINDALKFEECKKR